MGRNDCTLHSSLVSSGATLPSSGSTSTCCNDGSIPTAQCASQDVIPMKSVRQFHANHKIWLHKSQVFSACVHTHEKQHAPRTIPPAILIVPCINRAKTLNATQMIIIFSSWAKNAKTTRGIRGQM